jgi:riboflavin synthase
VLRGAEFDFDIGPETLLKTNLGKLEVGNRVNLERSLRVGDRLGGHFVQGHIDGVGTIGSRHRQGEWEDVWFRCPPELTRFMVPKGSIAVDGVSLTLVNVEANRFSIMLIPHTQAMTTLGFKQPGDMVNLETDILAKHVAKLLGK